MVVLVVVAAQAVMAINATLSRARPETARGREEDEEEVAE